jgi:outer membrane receptor protein involved in Fe transport
MVALKPQSRRCTAIAALSSAALLLAVPAAAPASVDSDEGTTAEESDEPIDAAAAPSAPEAPAPEDLGENRGEDMPARAGGSDELRVTGEPPNALEAMPTARVSFATGDLAALRIGDVEDFADYTPGLQIDTALGVSNPAIFIRGIGLKNYNANATGSVGIYQDGVNINAPAIQLGQLFDLEGVDVLRGPQGTVYARNATAGAILMRSNLPTGDFDVSANLTYGNYDDREIEAAVDVPLVKDLLSLRVSGIAQWRDGYTKNQCAGWDPTVYGYPVVSEATTQEIYDQLIPSATPVKVKAGTNGAVQDRYAYLDIDTVDYVNQNGITSGPIATGPSRNPYQLAEPVTLPNGDVLPIGTLVGLQANLFERGDVDGVCMIQAPGRIVTPLGAATNPLGLTSGQWVPIRPQPSLDEFAGLKSWTNNVDRWAARAVLLFEPLDNMDWMFNVHGQQNRGDSRHLQMLGANALDEGGYIEAYQNDFNEQTASFRSTLNGAPEIDEGWRNVKGIRPAADGLPGEGGGNPYSGFYSSDGREIVDHWGINGRGSWDLGLVLVTLLYDYEWYDREIQDEGDANPQRVFPAIWQDSAWQTTEDLRLEREGERYRATLGMFFLEEHLDATNTFPDTLAYFIQQRLDQKLRNWAPYATGTVELVEPGTIPGIDQLELSAGFRYNVEKRGFGLATGVVGTQSGAGPVLLPPLSAYKKWNKFTYDAQLSYTPFSNRYGTLLSYLKYSHGFKGGRFNPGLTIRGGEPLQSIDPVKPELVDDLEFGIRTHWLDDRLTLDGAVFRYWCDDLQVFDIENEAGALPLQQLLNANAKVFGAEATLVVRPLSGLTIEGNLGWLDSKYQDFTVIKTIQRPRQPNPTPAVFDYSGNQLVAAPEWTASLVSSYEIPLFGWGTLVPTWDFSYRSKVYLDPQMLDPISQDGYWIHNARLAYRTPGEHIEVAFWIANVFDEQYKLDTFDITREFNTILEAWGLPRTYGVTLSLNW